MICSGGRKKCWGRTKCDWEAKRSACLRTPRRNMPADKKKWHFGVLSFTGTGHLNPLIALSQELKDRGHKVTFFEKPKIEARIRQAGLEFIPIGATTASNRPTPPSAHSGMLSEILMLRFNLARVVRDIEIYLRDTPPALKQAGVDALLINEIALT